MKKYHVRVLVEVIADDKADAIIEARNKIYNDVHEDEFVVS